MNTEAAPAPLDGQLVTLPDGERVLWQPDTGRHLRLGPETPISNPPSALARRLGVLGFLSSEQAVQIPARSRWALFFPVDSGVGELWHALPMRRTSGGFPFAALPLDAQAVSVWRACDGVRTVSQIGDHLGLSTALVRDVLRPWMSIEVQAVQLRERAARAHEPALAYLLAPSRPEHARQVHHYTDGATSLAQYHQQQITDGSTHFDDRETTFAHAFAKPHPALGERTYGQALGDALVRDELMGTGPILEVGPGSGELCAAIHATVPSRAYLRLDLSPELLATQARRCPGTSSIAGSCTDMPIADASVDLVLCNEVIADLRAAPTAEGWPVEAEPEQALFNTGAFALMREIARVLQPGGTAFVSEFGGPEELPMETTHLDHPEVSIHFGQVAAVARAEGLTAELVMVGAFLGLDRTAEWLSRPSFEALRSRLASEGGHLPARAMSRETLVLPWPVEGLCWVPVTEPGCAPVVDRLWAVVLRKR